MKQPITVAVPENISGAPRPMASAKGEVRPATRKVRGGVPDATRKGEDPLEKLRAKLVDARAKGITAADAAILHFPLLGGPRGPFMLAHFFLSVRDGDRVPFYKWLVAASFSEGELAAWGPSVDRLGAPFSLGQKRF
jgi:hypothetical protein